MKKNVRFCKGFLLSFLFLSLSFSQLYAAGWTEKIKQKTEAAEKKVNSASKKVSEAVDSRLTPSESTKNSILTTNEKVEKAKEEITPEQKYYIGRAVAAKIFSGSPRSSNNATIEDYLNKICQALVINSDGLIPYKGFHVALLDSNDLNAVSTPGGHILISKGLVLAAESEDQLAAVLAHEISHVQLEHSVKSIKSARTVDAFFSVVETGKTIATNGKSDSSSSFSQLTDDLTDTLVSSGYSQTSEFEADNNAVELMAKAGYNPEAMTAMLDVLDKKLGSSNTGWGKTHPSPSTRKKAVKPAVLMYKMKSGDDTSSVRQARFKKAIASIK